MVKFLQIIVVLFVSSAINLIAQNLEMKLKTNDSTSAFVVADQSGNSNFRISGDGCTSFGSNNYNSNYLLVVASPYEKMYRGKSIGLFADWVYSGEAGSLSLSSGGNTNISFFNYPAQLILSGASNFDGGSVEIKAGNGEYNSGDISLTTGHGVQSGGDINLLTGYAAGGIGGNINIRCHDADAVQPGEITLSAGRSGVEQGGNIILIPGGGITTPGFVMVNGSGTYTGTWTQVADNAYKKNVQSLKDVSKKLLQLNSFEFNWDNKSAPEKQFPEKKQLGLDAEELEKLFPALVETDKDGIKSIDYSKVSVLLLEAFKEQEKRIINLTERIEQLETK